MFVRINVNVYKFQEKNMAGVSLSHVYKVYPNGTKAVNDLNLDINDKEFIVFVGSSGCGKSTSLRMIAGLEEITAGVIRIGGEVVNDLGPSDRDTAMVFQNYSLYPHLTVYQNIAFPLRMMKLPKAEIQEKVLSAAKILGLESLLDQKPDTLSGGQKQRVALGRAIVREPKVFLLDEPLSNLDAKLRTQMRAEITKLHKRLKTTFIYVTHDQVEAMTMGDRIVVMKDGYVQQIDTPTNLYRYPANKFVAGFIGSPPMNFYDAKVFVQGEGAEVEFANGQKMKINPREIIKLEKDYRSGKPLILGIRPEDIRIAEEESNRSVLCRIMQKEILGSETLLYADFDTEAIDYENSSSGVIIKVPGVPEEEAGAVVPIEFDFSKAQFFDAESEECVSKRFPEKDRIEVFIKDKTLYFGNAEIGLPQALGNLEGAYEMVFPITAIRKGNAFRAEVVYSEKAEGTCLARLVSGNQAFWAALPEEAGGNVSLDFAYEKLAFYRDGSGQAPVPEWNVLSGTLLKKKRKDKNEFGLKFDVVFAGEGFELECPEEITRKILGIGDRRAFGTSLELCFRPEAALPEGKIRAKVDGVLEYGSRKYLACRVGESSIHLPFREHASHVGFSVNMEEAALIDPATGIRIA